MIRSRSHGVAAIAFGIFAWLSFLFFQTTGIWGGDSADLVTAAITAGVPHPPGYPLYTWLGFLLGKLPVATPAWRVGLLSSIPQALTLVFVFLLVRRLTGSLFAAFFSSLFLFGNYLFFLYAITPEVFGLFDAFLVLLIYLSYLFGKTGKRTYLTWLSFVLGLSLAHHHVILFALPAMLVWIFGPMRGKAAKAMRSPRSVSGLAAWFGAGLLPYLYVPIAAAGRSIVNWDRAVNIPNFVRLVTRADYGTFVSSGFYGSDVSSRLLSLQAYIQFLWLDLTWVGLLLAALGCVWLRKKDPWFWRGSIVAFLFLGPVFFFYASFPLVNRFTLGTYERFLLPSYIFLSLWAGVGVFALVSAGRRLRIRFPVLSLSTVRVLAGLVILLFPFLLTAKTVMSFWGVRADRTANRLGEDILKSVPGNSILFLSHDTPLFTTQYVRYVLGTRPDVKVLHLGRFNHSDYLDVIAAVFPDLAIPSEHPDAREAEDRALSLIVKNSSTFPIASNTLMPAPSGWVWVPRGLVNVLTRQEDVPDIGTLLLQNTDMWETYQNPGAGILGRFNHLMLSDVRNVYTNSALEFGKILLRAGKASDAQVQFRAAIFYAGETQRADAYMYLGLSHLFLASCDEAIAAFDRAAEESLVSEPQIIYLTGIAVRDCRGDAAGASKILEEYERQKRGRETPLEAQ